MDIPTGIASSTCHLLQMSRHHESQQRKKEVLEVLVNASDQLLVEQQWMSVDKLRQKTIDHLTNEGKDPNLSSTSTKAIVSLKNDRGTSYDMYVRVYNELTAAYNIVRNEYSLKTFGKPYNKLRKKSEIDQVKKKYPKKLSEAEPVNKGGN